MLVRRVPAAAVLALILASGCGEREEAHDGHEHAGAGAPSEPPGHDKEAGAHAGHDHEGHEDQPAHQDHDHEGHTHDAPGASDPHDHDEESSHTDEVTLSAEALGRYGVRVEQAERRPLVRTFVAPARVSFNTNAMAHVGSALRGRVAEIAVNPGDVVRRGDTLLVIDSPELGEAQADFVQKGAEARASEPAVELARVAWERAKGLYEQSQGISLAEVQRREGEYRSAQAAQKAAAAGVLSAENRLHLLGMSQDAVEALAASGEITPRSIIRAPLDGSVLEREVTLGELVGPEREALLVLADTSVLWVLADVPEARLLEVAIGSPARVTLGAGAGAHRGEFEGTVEYIAPLVDAATRTAQVRVGVPSGALPLRAGMFAQVEITVSGGEEAVVAVPEEAVQTVEGGPAVFVPVEGEPNTFARRGVRIGRSVGGLVPVLSGLEVGESFVASGSFILKAELGKSSAGHQH